MSMKRLPLFDQINVSVSNVRVFQMTVYLNILQRKKYAKQIRDINTGDTLGPHQQGEPSPLLFHQVLKGYFNRPDETKEVLDSNGWLYTGLFLSCIIFFSILVFNQLFKFKFSSDIKT